MAPAMQVVLIGVQFDGYGRAGNQTSASQALRRAGFADAFAGATDRGDVIAHNQSGARGPTSIINEPAMIATQASVRHHVADALSRGCFPVVFGGDCTSLLGSVPAVRDVTGYTGLLHIDGHEDTTPLDVSEDGEGANAEIGLLLGMVGRSIDSPLVESPPALTLDALALLGQRDDAWRRDLNVSSLAHIGVWKRDAHQVALDPSGAARGAALHVAEQTKAWWLHVDVDVLDPAVFPAQGLPGVPDEPGGLTVEQLTVLVLTAVAMPECAGWSLAIYDPEQDPGGSCAQILVDLARQVSAILSRR